MLYAIQAGESGPIKLGVATDPRRRLKDLQVAHHEQLHLRAAWPGHRPEERDLHEHFARIRMSGEWFAPTPELTAFVEHRAAENHPLEGSPMRTLVEEDHPYEDLYALAACLPPSRPVRVDRAMAELAREAARVPLNPTDEAHALVELLRTSGQTQEQLAARLGRSQEAISNTIRLLNLPDSVGRLLVEGQLSKSHGRALLSAPDDVDCQEALAVIAARDRWSVRRLEHELSAATSASASGCASRDYDAWHNRPSDAPRSLPL